jgi:alkanesulfonate monooxygenase SsuD/methylene tetrahydromethanopterin reductase-like flavin-dependent oxidoreductase (luciferase family)
VPFLFARRMATLDHLTRGRIGWNIVTESLDSAARAMGFAAQIKHDDRYDLADENDPFRTRDRDRSGR